jgi:hypothetical protein
MNRAHFTALQKGNVAAFNRGVHWRARMSQVVEARERARKSAALREEMYAGLREHLLLVALAAQPVGEQPAAAEGGE